MPTYVYPEMPLEANVWWVHPDYEPTTEADETIMVSLSPIRPEDFFRGTQQGAPVAATHIIRTAPAPLLADNYVAGSSAPLLPGTLFEIPPGSGHYYATVWGHQVGAGFANHHTRVYVSRGRFGSPQPYPIFQGWI